MRSGFWNIMERVDKRMKRWRDIIRIIIIIAVLTGIFLIYPLRKIPLIPSESNYGKGEVWGTGNITEGKDVRQEFCGGPAYLQNISIYMQNLNEIKEGSLIITFYKQEKELKRQEVLLSKIENYEWFSIPINVWLDEEAVYTYTITTDVYNDDNILQIFETVKNNAPKENGSYSYCNEVREDIALAVNYRLLSPVENITDAIPFIAILLLTGGLLLETTCINGRKDNSNE